MYTETPFCINLCLPARWRTLKSHRYLVLLLTYLSYMSYHLSRRPFSIVKNVLNRNCTELAAHEHLLARTNSTTWCDWAPFDEENSNSLLGLLDSCFLVTYALGMFVSGFIAERCHLRYFLAFGMLLSGLATYALGLAFYYDIHSLAFFIIFQILCGLFQTTGWPAVVACVGNWFDKSSRGVIFGIWNSHTSVGNILGAVIAGAFVDYNWGLSFIVPGVIIGVSGFIMFLFLVPYPEEVDISSDDIHNRGECGGVHSLANDTESSTEEVGFAGTREDVERYQQQHRRNGMRNEEDHEEIRTTNEEDPLLHHESSINYSSSSSKSAISFINALSIPGVVEFSICLFFAKLVSYTFLFWLPRYLSDSTHASSSDSAYLSVPFDLGGIIGSVLAGYVVDKTGASAITCVVMLLFAIPSLYIYLIYGTVSQWTNIILQLVAGTFVNGPYALITTAVSAELGTKVKSSQALATVTAIIDGTGSLGAAVGPFFAGLVSGAGTESDWSKVFFMVMIADGLALLSLLRIAKQEYVRLRNRSHLMLN